MHIVIALPRPCLIPPAGSVQPGYLDWLIQVIHVFIDPERLKNDKAESERAALSEE